MPKATNIINLSSDSARPAGLTDEQFKEYNDLIGGGWFQAADALKIVQRSGKQASSDNVTTSGRPSYPNGIISQMDTGPLHPRPPRPPRPPTWNQLRDVLLEVDDALRDALLISRRPRDTRIAIKHILNEIIQPVTRRLASR